MLPDEGLDQMSTGVLAENAESHTVRWTASEFIAHDKDALWYIGLAAVAAMAAVVLYLVTKDVVTPIVVVAAAIIFGIYGSHRPRQIDYELSPQGISIGERHLTYDTFRCFSVVPDRAFSTIVLMPLKRFAVPLTLYYAPDDEGPITKILSEMLPYEPRQPDMTDRMLRKIRF